MRGRWMVMGLALALPAPAGAQVVSRKDLIGTWLNTQTSQGVLVSGGNIGQIFMGGDAQEITTQETLTFRADSNWTKTVKVNGKQQQPDSGKWYFSGDTLWLGNPAATMMQNGATVPTYPPIKITLKGNELTYNDPKRVYKRSDSPAP